MNLIEIFELARQAGFFYSGGSYFDCTGQQIAAFYKLVEERAATKEREACAELRKTLSAIPNRHVPQLQPAVESALDFYAERIRARGEA